ncbi:hypothetical protein HWV62_30399 [Athelia sp. TMB]|nr:hypothetical protein HWV62_30399 [Athelia sp. TMB]
MSRSCSDMDSWRVAVLGDGGVGKTALAVQTYDPTIEDAYRKQLVVDNKMCFVEVIDTAGQEEYATLRDQWVRLEVFRQSMLRVKRSKPIFMLVGNKCDKTYEREVSKEEGLALARSFGCNFVETSAKTAHNVEHLFTSLVRALRSSKPNDSAPIPSPPRPIEEKKPKKSKTTRDDPPVKFGVLRKALVGSDVFRAYPVLFHLGYLNLCSPFVEGDMFDCCEEDSPLDDEVLDLDEPADRLSILLSLLHQDIAPPDHIPNLEPYGTTIRTEEYQPGSVIPFPLLPTMLQLVDKYALSEKVQKSLLAHLSSHVAGYPLKVYGYATEHGLRDLAVEASIHLLHPPLSFYSPHDLKVIPVPEAWHELVLLHEVRIRGLRRLLLAEEIFPHSYGECSSHKEKTKSLWKQRKAEIILKVEADVAAEMGSLQQELSSCKTCCTACIAAVDMLAVIQMQKVAKVDIRDRGR